MQNEGPAALGKGLLPAYGYQIAANGTRLGSYAPIKVWQGQGWESCRGMGLPAKESERLAAAFDEMCWSVTCVAPSSNRPGSSRARCRCAWTALLSTCWRER